MISSTWLMLSLLGCPREAERWRAVAPSPCCSAGVGLLSMGVDGWLHEGVAVLEPHSATDRVPEGVEGRVTAGVTHNEPQDVPELLAVLSMGEKGIRGGGAVWGRSSRSTSMLQLVFLVRLSSSCCLETGRGMSSPLALVRAPLNPPKLPDLGMLNRSCAALVLPGANTVWEVDLRLTGAMGM